MSIKFIAIAAAALAGVAFAACPNLCNGHGTCGPADICACYAGWEGVDCSSRVCPSGAAWIKNSADPHSASVCSGQGACNSATGECDCFPGFSGRACSRMSCPNSCSGHGKCVLISEAAVTPYSESNWDARKIETCECDPGYAGADCSQRLCPTGDDPLTFCNTDDKQHIQEVRFTLGSEVEHDATVGAAGTYTAGTETMALFGTSATTTFATVQDRADFGLRIAYVDSFGAEYVAHAPGSVISDDNVASAASMEIALETLPATKVYNVKVGARMTKSGNANNGGIDKVIQRRYMVTFVPEGSQNVGLQYPLTCSSGYSCTAPGCQPMVTMPFLYRYAGTTASHPVGEVVTIGSGEDIEFFTGARDTNAAFAAMNFIRLHADSQPQMPVGFAVDSGITAGSLRRYDIRVLVAVMDPNNDMDDDVDVYYTRVIFGHSNITDSRNEAVGSARRGVWTSGMTGADELTTTLDGFIYNGQIPSDYSKVPVPGAPGVFISFASQDYASNSEGRWFEILIKLPDCSVTEANEDMYELDSASQKVKLVDEKVENMECAGRGTCDRSSGSCKCFSGFVGTACETFTAIV